MLSLYNVVKKNNVIKKDKKQIITRYESPVKNTKESEETKEDRNDKYTEMNSEEYDSVITLMFDNYIKKGEEIISEAYKKAVSIEEEAYKKAYDKGFKEGMDKGYKESYEKAYVENMEKAREEGNTIIEEAKEISKTMINSSENQCEEYIKEKSLELKKLIENIVESVFKREIKDEDALNQVVTEALDNAKKSKSITIKCRDLYKDEIKKSIDLWKSQNVFNGDTFIIEDNSLEEGVALLEKDNGAVKIDILESLEKIKEILKSED